jgi:hypothetical protein
LDASYQLVSHYYEQKFVVYRCFMVSKDGRPALIYNLGITRTALQLYNYKNSFDPQEWLWNLGLTFIQEMIEAQDLSRSSGIITSLEMSKKVFNWRYLEQMDENKAYIK